jgi:hypothetical protein
MASNVPTVEDYCNHSFMINYFDIAVFKEYPRKVNKLLELYKIPLVGEFKDSIKLELYKKMYNEIFVESAQV